ncbi:unnamed protein product [Closterium sp. NIES-65]|nr:unnamed protein product [Closterium sp. NIES-65]
MGAAEAERGIHAAARADGEGMGEWEGEGEGEADADVDDDGDDGEGDAVRKGFDGAAAAVTAAAAAAEEEKDDDELAVAADSFFDADRVAGDDVRAIGVVSTTGGAVAADSGASIVPFPAALSVTGACEAADANSSAPTPAVRSSPLAIAANPSLPNPARPSSSRASPSRLTPSTRSAPVLSVFTAELCAPPFTVWATKFCGFPMNKASYLSIRELNVNGLGSRGKQKHLKAWLKKPPDIFVLIDTRIGADHDFWKKLKAPHCHAVGPAGKAGGVAILSFNKSLSFTNIVAHGSGRLLQANVQWDSSCCSILAAYFPAKACRRRSFYGGVLTPFMAHSVGKKNFVLVGDLNMVEDPILDRSSGAGSSGENNSVLRICSAHCLTDAFRWMNPVLKEFTFLSKSAKTSSRIDRALVSASLLPSLSGASHCRPLKGLSDHWFGVKVTFKISLRLCMGPGIWRCKAVEIGRPGAAKAVAEVREKHGKTGSGDFTALMREMNMALRKYSTEERKRVKATLAHLDAAVARLQQEVMRHPSCSVRKEELKVKESQLAAYLASKEERVSLMAGVKELREGELPGKLMSTKVKTRKERTMITSFTFWTVAPDRKLGEEQSQLLVEDWSEAEVKEALDGMAKGKSPGADGIPKEFFSQHWDSLGGDVLGFAKRFEETTVLPPAALEAVTVLLHKKGAKDQVQNYRPITLLNSTYKLVARVLANRMRKVLHKVISEEQYGFLPGRRLADGVSLIADIVDAAKCKNADWYLLLVDFQKAFDSVSREYLFGTIKRMGFPRKFVRWCEGLHAGSTTRLLLNGWLGEPVAVKKGVRQGCPLAPYLFLCAVEPLCQEAIRRKLGISNPFGDRLAYLGYADDTTLVLQGKRQIGRAVKVLDEFGDKSGLRVNIDKSALLPLGKNLLKKPDRSSGFKWVRSNEAERVIGVWISPLGDASVTWEITLSRAAAELVKWQIHYLTTSGRVAVVNGYINPILAFQAQVYPPPAEIWAKLVKLLHNFVTGNHSTAGKHFALWSQELLFKARGEGGLGVRDPCAELGGLAARRIALLASQPQGLLADLALTALDVPDLQVFWAHAGLMKQWAGRCERWKRTCELFLESSFPSCIKASSVWEVEQEMLLFNRCLLLNGKSPAGRQKAAKPLKRSVKGDFIKIAVDGSRALKSPQELERAFGGSDGAKLAMRIFDAAPNEWKQMLMAPVTACMVLTVSKFVLKAGTSYGVWRIECVEGETLICRAIGCFQGVLEEAEERTHNFLPHEVVPAVVREGRLLGPAGGPRARLLCSPIWEGDRPAQLKQLKEGFRRFGGKPKQQSTWEESLGRPIDWGRVIGVRDSPALPNRARDVMLRIHSRNLQVGERLHFLGAGVACPHCGEKETLEHGLFLCSRIQPVVRALLKALRMIYKRAKAVSKRLGAIRPGLDDDECRVLGRIMDNSAQPATWSKGFMAIWSNPRAAFRPP